jgi:hypothetical protein
VASYNISDKKGSSSPPAWRMENRTAVSSLAISRDSPAPRGSTKWDTLDPSPAHRGDLECHLELGERKVPREEDFGGST